MPPTSGFTQRAVLVLLVLTAALSVAVGQALLGARGPAARSAEAAGHE